MEDFEKVEKLRERANVTYEEAKEALEKNNGDILDAMVYLEKSGKVKSPGETSYRTQYEEPKTEAYQDDYTRHSLSEMLGKFGNWCKKVIKKGNETYFEIFHKEERVLSVPVTAFVIIMFFTWHIALILMVIGLFCQFRYAFRGIGTAKVNLNQAMDKAAETAESVKEEFKKGMSE